MEADNFKGHAALFDELLPRDFHLLTSPVAHSEAVDDGPLAVLAGDGVGVDDFITDAVRAVSKHGHGDELIGRSADEPVMHVADDGVGRREGGREAARLNDGSAAGLDGLDKLVLE